MGTLLRPLTCWLETGTLLTPCKPDQLPMLCGALPASPSNSWARQSKLEKAESDPVHLLVL